MKNFKEIIKKWRRMNAAMLSALVLLALTIPVDIIAGNYLNAATSVLWVFIGIRAYAVHERATESAADAAEIIEAQDQLRHINNVSVNPLGEWTGGIDVDCGATNRKLGSDMGDAVTGGWLHGKDLSKADVSVNIVCHLIADERQMPVEAICSIGDTEVTFRYGNESERVSFDKVVERARDYINECGGFEQFAEWGLI